MVVHHSADRLEIPATPASKPSAQEDSLASWVLRCSRLGWAGSQSQPNLTLPAESRGPRPSLVKRALLGLASLPFWCSVSGANNCLSFNNRSRSIHGVRLWPDASRACEPGQLLRLPRPCSCLSLVGMETRSACLPAMGLPGGAPPRSHTSYFRSTFPVGAVFFFFFLLFFFLASFLGDVCGDGVGGWG